MIRLETNHKEILGNNTQNDLCHSFCDHIAFIGNSGKNSFLNHDLLLKTHAHAHDIPMHVIHALSTREKSMRNF